MLIGKMQRKRMLTTLHSTNKKYVCQHNTKKKENAYNTSQHKE